MIGEGVCRTAPATPGLLINKEGVCRTALAKPGLLIIHVLLLESDLMENKEKKEEPSFTRLD